MIKILFVCHGNICRSTMAQSVFQHMVNQERLTKHYAIDSAATSTEEIGNGPHHGTVRKLNSVGIPVVPHRAQQMKRSDYDTYDYLIGMDEMNIRNMNRMCGGDPNKKIKLLLDFTTRRGCAIADPWYTGDFEATYQDVYEGCSALLRYSEKQRGNEY